MRRVCEFLVLPVCRRGDRDLLLAICRLAPIPQVRRNVCPHSHRYTAYMCGSIETSSPADIHPIITSSATGAVLRGITEPRLRTSPRVWYVSISRSEMKEMALDMFQFKPSGSRLYFEWSNLVGVLDVVYRYDVASGAVRNLLFCDLSTADADAQKTKARISQLYTEIRPVRTHSKLSLLVDQRPYILRDLQRWPVLAVFGTDI